VDAGNLHSDIGGYDKRMGEFRNRGLTRKWLEQEEGPRKNRSLVEKLEAEQEIQAALGSFALLRMTPFSMRAFNFAG
jgi:hypothetical protein